MFFRSPILKKIIGREFQSLVIFLTTWDPPFAAKRGPAFPEVSVEVGGFLGGVKQGFVREEEEARMIPALGTLLYNIFASFLILADCLG